MLLKNSSRSSVSRYSSESFENIGSGSKERSDAEGEKEEKEPKVKGTMPIIERRPEERAGTEIRRFRL